MSQWIFQIPTKGGTIRNKKTGETFFASGGITDRFADVMFGRGNWEVIEGGRIGLPTTITKQLEQVSINPIIVPINPIIERKQQELKTLKRFTLTSAQILALNTTPVTLIEAFLNSNIIVEGITARLNFNTTAYTGANALEFRYTNASGVKVTADLSSAFLNSAATAYASVAGIEAQITPVLNAPIIIVVPTANPATGNSTLDLFIRFKVITW